MQYDFSSIANTTVLITGGSGQIGQALAEGFVQKGAKVVLWGHREVPKKITSTMAAYEVVELENIQELTEAFQDAEKRFGGVDTLINCAGYTRANPSETYPLEDWNRTLAVNLTAPFVLSQCAANSMLTKRKAGHILNIASIGGTLGFPNNPAYLASKGGLRQLTKAFAMDLGQYGIRVNCIGPGYIQTKMTQGSWENLVEKKKREDRTMLGRWGQPEDLVGLAIFLSSGMAQYITGQCFYVDGGWTAKGL